MNILFLLLIAVLVLGARSRVWKQNRWKKKVFMVFLLHSTECWTDFCPERWNIKTVDCLLHMKLHFHTELFQRLFTLYSSLQTVKCAVTLRCIQHHRQPTLSFEWRECEQTVSTSRIDHYLETNTITFKSEAAAARITSCPITQVTGGNSSTSFSVCW